MSNNLAYRTDHVSAPQPDMLGETPRQELRSILGELTTAAASYRAAQHIAVEIADAAQLADMRAAWTELLSRADAPNVFMDPALLRAAASIDPAGGHRALLAWKSLGGLRQLVGVWAFAPGRARRSLLPLRVLNAPPCVHGFLATPVIDRCHLDDTLDAMLDCIAADPRLPKIVALDAIGTDAPTYDALLRVLADRDSEPCIFDQWRRPKLSSELDGKAYDETYRDYSPGTLLLEDYTAALLADKSIAFVDSCSHDDRGFMPAWSERQPVADLWIDARRGGSLAFRVLCGAQIGYRQMRGTARSAYLAWRNSKWRKPRKR